MTPILFLLLTSLFVAASLLGLPTFFVSPALLLLIPFALAGLDPLQQNEQELIIFLIDDKRT
ncbi:MAG: hypothetical protein RR853_09060 [Aurantimicrobium sp.]